MITLRPAEARWFETYVPREQTVCATELLARTGAVQLELDPSLPLLLDEQKLRHLVAQSLGIMEVYRDILPAGVERPTALVGSSVHLANLALHRLRVWSARVDYLREHLEQLRADRDYLALLSEGLEALHAAGLDLEGLPRHTRFLCKCFFACPPGCCERDEQLGAMVRFVVKGPEHDFPFLVGVPEQGDVVARMVLEGGCEQVGLPTWLSTERARQITEIEANRVLTDNQIAGFERELMALCRDAHVAEANANIQTLAWYLEHAAGHLRGQGFCHVTGWTTARNPQVLQQALRDAGIGAIIRFPDAPSFATPPTTTLASWWASPFRPLLLLWGPPGRQEVDPSGLLALIVPLLFGYMFPDVGHGAMLVVFALLLWRRWPEIRFLLPCGIAAILFGFLTGEVFGLEGVIPALWLRPLDDPLTLLAVPMAFGVLLLLLGLVFGGIEAYWRGQLTEWFLGEAAVLALYPVLLLGLVFPLLLWLILPILVQHVIGTLLLARRARLAVPASLAGGLGRLVLGLFELALNTLSFVRVGAFALAHAALSHAVVTLAGMIEEPSLWLLAMVLGNLFAVTLEALVVFVQTTRLALFEFFTKFLRADGRIFRPMRAPP